MFSAQQVLSRFQALTGSTLTSNHLKLFTALSSPITPTSFTDRYGSFTIYVYNRPVTEGALLLSPTGSRLNTRHQLQWNYVKKGHLWYASQVYDNMVLQYMPTTRATPVGYPVVNKILTQLGAPLASVRGTVPAIQQACPGAESPSGRKSGTCVQNGVTYTFANANQTLSLSDYIVRFEGVRVVRHIRQPYLRPLTAKGRFAVIELRARNTSNTTFGSLTLASLQVGHHIYKMDGDASAVYQARLHLVMLKAHRSNQLPIVFDLPTKVATSLPADSLLYLPGDYAGLNPQHLGLLRLWTSYRPRRSISARAGHRQR